MIVRLHLARTDAVDVGGQHAHAVGVVALKVRGDEVVGADLRILRRRTGGVEDRHDGACQRRGMNEHGDPQVNW